MADFQKAQSIVALNEGGYQDDPKDSGNYYMGQLIGTNWGISSPTLASYLGRVPTRLEMQNLSKRTAEDILKRFYWLKNNLDRLKNQSVATLIYDGVVNHGTNATRFILEGALRALGTSISYYEVFTLKGIHLLNRQNQKRLFNVVKSIRAKKYRESKKSDFLTSWLARLDRIHYYPGNTFSGIWPYVAVFAGAFSMILIALL